MFVRSDVPGASPQEKTDPQYAAELKGMDPVPSYALHVGATTAYSLGLLDRAIYLARDARTLDSNCHEAWALEGQSLASRARVAMSTDPAQARRDLLIARERLSKALDIRPGFWQAAASLANVQRELDRLGG